MRATDFILSENQIPQPGALLIHQSQENSENSPLEVGIAFHPQIQKSLFNLAPDTFEEWNKEETNAFSVATEEISHFRYLIFHAEKHRSISQLELEFHGEIDKFLLLHLLHQKSSSGSDSFEKTFQLLFEQASLLSDLSTEAKERYTTASQLAREFIHKHRQHFSSSQDFPALLLVLRALYRMGSEEKFSLKNRL